MDKGWGPPHPRISNTFVTPTHLNLPFSRPNDVTDPERSPKTGPSLDSNADSYVVSTPYLDHVGLFLLVPYPGAGSRLVLDPSYRSLVYEYRVFRFTHLFEDLRRRDRQ